MSQAQLALNDGRAVQPHNLCVNCKAFWERATCLNFTVEELSTVSPDVLWMPQHLIHSKRELEIQTAAELGCHFCSILLGSLTGCTGDHHPLRISEFPIYISISCLEKEGGFLLNLYGCEQHQIASDDPILTGHYPVRLLPIIDQSQNPSTAREILPSKLNLQLENPTLSRTHKITFSEVSAGFINSWIRECQESHSLCGEKHLTVLHGLTPVLIRPRRLLDLQAFESPDQIRLIDAEHQQDLQYCTLSYSWGLTKPFWMTSNNLSSLQENIRVADLPKTIRDAIHVARGVGLRYLWIDALCIMQNGKESVVASDDWLDQAGKMNDIYGNSVVTIAASEAHDGGQGFIMQRNPLSHIVCRIDLNSKARFEVVPPCRPFCLQHTFDDAQYHLDTRSWVLQERLLSARTIHITRNFIHLECRTELRCEAMSDITRCSHSGAIAKARYEELFTHFYLPGMEELEKYFEEAFTGGWHRIMRKYSTTNLSRPSDMLVALAGLAKPLQERFQLTSSFGLWREFLLRDMLWYVRGGRGDPTRDRAPTWSWASIDVRGPEILYNASFLITIVAEIITLPEATDFTRQPALPANEARFVIKVKGKLKPGVPTSTGHGNDRSSSRSLVKNSVLVHPNCRGMPHLHPECPFHPDYELPANENMQLYSLLIAHGSNQIASTDYFDTEIGLVLTPVKGHGGRYRRVGYFHHSRLQKPDSEEQGLRPPFFDGSDRVREIEIV
jgi:Heterokaryon incompatibility protein (HET)